MFYIFFLYNFVVLMFDLYFKVCLRFGGNEFYFSLDEIEFDFVT